MKFEAHEFWAVLREVPHHVPSMNHHVFDLGVGCLVALSCSALPGRLLKVMPPPVWVFLAGTLVSTFILKLDKHYLIDVPDSLKHGIVFPSSVKRSPMQHCGSPSSTWRSPCF